MAKGVKIKLSFEEVEYAPFKLKTTGRDNLYVIPRIRKLGLKWTRHGHRKEHFRSSRGQWNFDRKLTPEQRAEARRRFTYQPDDDRTIYLIPKPEVHRLGRRLMNIRTGVIAVTVDRLLEEFPYEQTDGVRGEALLEFLNQTEEAAYIGFDLESGLAVVTFRDESEQVVLGLPLKIEELMAKIEGTPFEEGVLKPVVGAAEDAIDHIVEHEALAHDMESDAEKLTEAIVHITTELFDALEERVGVTFSGDETA